MNLTLQKKNGYRGKKTWQSITLLLVATTSMPTFSIADELSDCMAKMMVQASDSTTMGELRSSCEQQLKSGVIVAAENAPSALSKRMDGARKTSPEPFTLMAHKPNYLLVGKHNTAGYNAEPYQQQFNDSSIAVDETEAQFQLSIKTPLAIGLWDTVDIYAAYTNKSFWQVYNDNSAPFRETNHEPEAWVQFNPNWELWGFHNVANTFGLIHQSNGRGGTLSRSWNRVAANFMAEKGNLAISFKPWYRIPEDLEDNDNPDITDYLGHYEIRAAYKWREHVFSVMSRNNLESGFSKGAIEISWSFPLGSYPYVKGYVQYFTGYGESLIDYNNYVNSIGVGIALTDWL